MRDALTSFGLLLLRAGFGGLMLVHGYQKLVDYQKLVETFPDPLGIGSQYSLMGAIGAEFGCSILLIVGLATRLAALPLAFTMGVAHFVIHANDAWQTKELSAVYLCAYVALFFTGPGRLSLDHLILKRLRGDSGQGSPPPG